MKIKIKLDKNGKIKKVRSSGSTGLARAAVKTIVDKPGRYAIKHKSTGAAFRAACITAGSLEDVPRHQSEG